MSSNGTLSRLSIVGHRTLRNIDGPDSSAVWQIKMKDYENGQTVSSLSPVVYGKLPKGYVQVYPEQGEAAELEENVTCLRPSREPMLIMFDWFSTLAAGSELSMDATAELHER